MQNSIQGHSDDTVTTLGRGTKSLQCEGKQSSNERYVFRTSNSTLSALIKNYFRASLYISDS